MLTEFVDIPLGPGLNVPMVLKVLPWNGYGGAISMTFDDGDPSQLEVAVPELSKRRLRATFFLISGRLTREAEWKKASDGGQEIGNHSVDHKRPRTLAPGEAEKQVLEAKIRLEGLFQKPVSTFAYPFTDIDPDLRRSAKTHHLLSRGGMGGYYFSPGTDPDWDYLPSQVAYSLTSPGVLKGWADRTVQEGAWTIAQFHAFDGTATGWQPLPPKTFTEFLDYLKDREQELWIAPMGEVGAYWRAQKTLEEANVKTEGRKTLWTWRNLPLLPKGLFLKVKVEKKNVRLTQGEDRLEPDATGVYRISMDGENLQLEETS